MKLRTGKRKLQNYVIKKRKKKTTYARISQKTEKQLVRYNINNIT